MRTTEAKPKEEVKFTCLIHVDPVLVVFAIAVAEGDRDRDVVFTGGEYEAAIGSRWRIGEALSCCLLPSLTVARGVFWNQPPYDGEYDTRIFE